MKIYCGRNRHGVWKASLDETKLDRFADVFESEIENIYNGKVYMIMTYHGYDYNYDPESDPIYNDIKYVFQVFHSVSRAKKHETWKQRENAARKNPKAYHVTPFSVASDDFGLPFTFGDVMSGKFNMKIIGVKVI